MKPLLSVIMPVFNAGKFLHESIPSILNQTFKDFEFIIIDDGSTDDSLEIISSYSAQDARIKIVSNFNNIGYVTRLNQGILVSIGKYIARMDADDISASKRFQLQVQLLEKDSDLVLCGSWGIILNSDKKLEYPSKDGDIKVSLADFNPFIHSSVIFRKSVIDHNQLFYREECMPAEDYKLWTELSRHGSFCIIEENLIQYRISSSQVSKQFSNLQFQIGERIKYEYLSESFNLPLPLFYQPVHINNWYKLFKILSFWTLAESKNDIINKFDKFHLRRISHQNQRKIWDNYFSSLNTSVFLSKLEMLLLSRFGFKIFGKIGFLKHLRYGTLMNNIAIIL